MSPVEQGSGLGAADRPPYETLLREAWAARARAEAAEARAEIALAQATEALRDAETAHRLAEAAARRHEFLSSAGRLMAQSLDYRTTLEQVARAAVPVLADWCAVTIVREDGSFETLTAAHADPSLEKETRLLLLRHPLHPAGEHGAARAIRTGEVELLRDVGDEQLAAASPGDPERLRALLRLTPRQLLTVPLRTPGGTLGALSFVLMGSERSFADEDVQVAVSLAARASLHVQNARMYTERSRIAHTLQRSLLPARLPEIPGLEVAARYLAAGEQHEVGGDFYDVFPSGDGLWTAFVGDVSGKGAEAAALTGLTRHTLYAAALRTPDPVEQLRLANEAMRTRGDGSRFATLVHVQVRTADGEARLAVTNAGHPPPLVLRADGTVEELDGRGTLLGVVEEPAFDPQAVRLGPGELVILYTDGVSELRGRPLDFGVEQIRATLQAHAGAPATAVAEAVERRSLELAGGRPADDRAVLVLRVPPLP